MTGRCCIIGQSGSGKSYLVGVIAEELGKLGLPFVIVDTEEEYSSLKEGFRAIWIGSDARADLPPDIDYSLLFKDSIESGIPIILDVSEITDKNSYVEGVLSSLYALEEKLRKPYLVIVEEAEKFAPQVMHKGTNMIEEISVRGRKRGIGLIVATQRPASISKNVLSQCSYGFIGKLTIENDLSAIGILLENRAASRDITRLHTGEFVPFGIEQVENFMVKKRAIKPGGGTPNLDISVTNSPNLSKLIAELKHGAKDRAAGRMARRGIRILSLKSNYSMDDAQLLAMKLVGKWPKIFNRGETVESVGQMYLPMLYSQILLPTRNRSVFRELYVLTDAKNRLITLNKRKFFVKYDVNPSFSIGYHENIVLSSLREAGSISSSKIETETRMKPAQLRRVLSRLSNAGIIASSKGRYSIIECSRCALKHKLNFDETSVDEASIDSTFEKKKALHYTKLLFPACEVSPISVVYVPFYKIVLRSGSNIRMLAFDALFMKERSEGLLR